MKLATGILRFLHRLVQRIDAAPPIRRTCYSCRKEIEGQVIEFEGRPYCSYFCIPAVSRAKAAGVRP